MPSKDTKILQFHQNQKSDKAPFIIYAGKDYVYRSKDCVKGFRESLREHGL